MTSPYYWHTLHKIFEVKYIELVSLQLIYLSQVREETMPIKHHILHADKAQTLV